MLQCRDWRRNSRRSGDRRPSGESTPTPDASVRRRRAVSRTPRPRRVGSASSFSCVEEVCLPQSLNGAEEWRGLRSPRAQAAGPGHRDERLRPERCPDPAVPGRRSAARISPRAESSWTICVYLRFLRAWVGAIRDVFVSSCLRCARLCALCVSVVLPVVTAARRLPLRRCLPRLPVADRRGGTSGRAPGSSGH